MKKNISNEARYVLVNQQFEFSSNLFESFRAADKVGVYPEEFQTKYLEILDARKGFRAIKMLAVEKVKLFIAEITEARLKASVVIDAHKDNQDALTASDKELYDKLVIQNNKLYVHLVNAEAEYKKVLVDAKLFFRSECKAAKRNHHEHFTKKICNRLKQLKAA